MGFVTESGSSILKSNVWAKMIFKSNIKWVALIGLILSLFSLLLHLLLAKFSNVSLVEYSALTGLQEGLHPKLGTQVN